MKAYLLFDPKQQELSMISSCVGFLLKRQGNFQIPDCTQKLERLKCYVESDDALKFLVCDATVPGVLPVLEKLRGKNSDMKLVLVADNSIPPFRYIKPSILPTALLWRPLEQGSINDTLWEVLSSIAVQDDTQPVGGEDAFCIEFRGMVKRYAYQDIGFFESRDKKLLLHLNHREISFAGTLEKLTEILPARFIRVHKSFIVNRTHVVEIQFGQNQLLLEGGIVIPISRSYKSDVKAVFS